MPSKETFYFSHDYNSRNDPKMVALLMKTGIIGVGVYWCIVEMLYEQGGYITLKDCERIAFELRTQSDLVQSVIESNLFKNNGELFWSESVIKRLNERKIKSAKARESANIKWEYAKGLRTHTDRNAIKERKGNKINGGVGEKNNLPICGIEVKNGEIVFQDGSSRKLTLSEQSLFDMKELKPELLIKK
jgi:hypothetical protein